MKYDKSMTLFSRIKNFFIRPQAEKPAPTLLREDFLKILQNTDLFKDIAMNEQIQIANLMYIKEYKLGEFVIHEGDRGDSLYIILEGQVEILKRNPESLTMYRINTINENDYFGEIALIQKSKRTASVRAIAPLKLLVLETQEFYEQVDKKDIHHHILHHLSNKLYERINYLNEFSVKALERELEQTKIRNNMGRFLIGIIALLCIYAFCMRVTDVLLASVPATTLISTSMMFLFLMIAIITTKMMPYPLKFYGLTFENWQQASVEGIVFTLPILILILLAKFILIRYTFFYHDASLFKLYHTLNNLKGYSPEGSILFWFGMILLYSFHTLIQEYTVRGVLQSPMQEFFTTEYRFVSAIICSNIIFSTLHVFLSVTFALFTFIPGLFWGWLYMRHKTLIGTSLSHILLGVWTLFIVGF